MTPEKAKHLKAGDLVRAPIGNDPPRVIEFLAASHGGAEMRVRDIIGDEWEIDTADAEALDPDERAEYEGTLEELGERIYATGYAIGCTYCGAYEPLGDEEMNRSHECRRLYFFGWRTQQTQTATLEYTSALCPACAAKAGL